MTKVVAHRGASADAPENTLAAFALAIEQGAQGIELDVQMTSDGELVVIHDENLERTTTGKGFVFQHSYKDLEKLDAGSWFSEKHKGEKVPRLIDVLGLIRGRGLVLNIELKTGYVQYPGIEERLAALLEHHASQQVIVSSFNHYSLRTLKAIAPQIPIGLLYMEGLVEPWHYAKRMKAYSLHPLYLNIIPELVTGCNQAGIALFPWTVDKLEDMKRLAQARVEGIITNRPSDLIGVLGGSI